MFITNFELEIIQVIQRMGQTQTHSNIEQQYDIVKLRDDGSALLKHKKTHDQYLLRREEISCFEDILRKRQLVKSPHLLDLIQIRRKEEKNVCSVAHRMYMLIEYPFKTVKDQIMDKISQNKVVPFLQAQLWSILYSCCVGLNALYDKKMPHQCLTSNQIYLNREGIIKISDPILFGLQKNYIKVLKNSNEHVHISPQIINFLDDCNFSFYDKEKSDVFVLGAIMLEASLLRSIQLFDQQTKRPNLDVISSSLKQLRQKYSQSYCDTLEKMLQLHSKLRPKFSEITYSIEKENSLYQSTDEASLHQITQTAQQANQAKNYQSHKTLPRPAWKNEKKQAVGSNFSYKTVQKDSSNANKNNESFRPDDTIIKMLQTDSLNKSYANSYAPSPNPIILPPNQVQQIFYQQKPMVPPYNFLPPNQPQFIIPAPSPNQFPVIVNSRPPSARPFEVDDRFSYTKFGNIELPKQPVKQKPIFSYDIPEINEILRSQANSQVNRQKSMERLHSQPTQIHVQPQPKAQNTQLQSFPRSFYQPPPQKESQPQFNEQKQIKMAPTQKHFNPQSTTYLEQADKSKKPLHQANIFVKNYQNQPQKIKQGYPNKISLNGILKENEVKKNEIYPVTQKSEENLETSPAKVVLPNSSPYHIKEPQKSPGPSIKKSLTYERSSSKKSLKNADQEPKYVVLILQGGGKYEGMMKNGMKNGQGKLQFNDGGFYVGEWKDNKMHGFGKLHYENGQIAYEGQWQNDQFCGHGRVFNDRPQKLIGPFNYNDFADLGQKWIYYEGEFKNDSKHGKGKIRLTNGEVFQGNFVFDSIEGEGTFYTSKGEAIRGSWTDNMLTQS